MTCLFTSPSPPDRLPYNVIRVPLPSDMTELGIGACLLCWAGSYPLDPLPTLLARCPAAAWAWTNSLTGLGLAVCLSGGGFRVYRTSLKWSPYCRSGLYTCENFQSIRTKFVWPCSSSLDAVENVPRTAAQPRCLRFKTACVFTSSS